MNPIDADMMADQAVLIGLLSREQLRDARNDAEDGSAEALSRVFLRKGMLTSWQIDRLMKGEATGFFYGNYKVLFHLAEGTFARVYRGEKIDSGQPVAIKVLRRRFTTDHDAVARFGLEAEAGMKLIHPNIVRIYEYGESDRNNYMIMEYLEGSNLRDLLKIRKHLDTEAAMPIMVGLAHGLDYSHSNGVTHRDIKGTNILISNRREAKLVDFGLATVAGDRISEFAHTRTVDYSALERTCGSPKGDPRSDIYFLGCVYYQMLTGVLPLPEVETSDPLAKMLKRSFGAIKPIHEHRQAPPPEISAIIEKMMQIDLKKRYQTMGDVVRAFEEYKGRDTGEQDGAKNGRSAGPELLPHEMADADLLASAFASKAPASATNQPPASNTRTPTPTPTPEPVTDSPIQSRPPLEGRSPRVLCVEVQESIQEAFRKAFSKMGYDVELVQDAEAAVELFRETPPPDALVYDVDGLGPDGFQAFLSIYGEAQLGGHDLPSLVLLGPRQANLARRLPDDERVLLLIKPLKLRDVQDAITQLAPIHAGEAG